MSAPVILNNPQLSENDLQELKGIFFDSSTRKEFKDPEEKEAFYWKYLGFYLTHHPELLWIAKSERILGYIVGIADSENEELLRIQPHLSTFKAYFKDYPAHLHINLHNESRGMGLGSKLLSELENQLQQAGIIGLHIMTGPDSRNKNFYSRLGFNFEVTLEFRGADVLLMGKRLHGTYNG